VSKLEPGTVLRQRYKINGMVGQGAMAMVFSADDQQTKKQVAIKQMGTYLDDPEEAKLAIEQFEHEAQLLHDLQHPNIPRVYEWFEEGGDRYLVMDFVEGEVLTRHAGLSTKDPAQRARVTPAQVVDWAIQITRALQYLHSQKPRPIIYKDLKPDNLMLGKDGRIMVLDFGIAKGRDQKGQYKTILKGMVSPGYAAPEQYSGVATDPRTDLYALGATIYALLTGQVPPQSVDRQQSIFNREPDPLIPARQYNPDVSPQLEVLIFRLMALKREQRMPSADQVMRELEALPERTNKAAAPATTAKSGGFVTVLLWIGIIVLGLLLSALAVWYFVLSPDARNRSKSRHSSARPSLRRSASASARSELDRMAGAWISAQRT